MAGWPKLNPLQQREVLDRLTAMVLEAVPDDWECVVLRHSQVGDCVGFQDGLMGTGWVQRSWASTPEMCHRFQDLRRGMYVEGQGTWFTAWYRLVRPSRYTLKYEWEADPDFPEVPPGAEFVLEQERFPRAVEFMPDWFREGLTAGHGRIAGS